MKLRQRILAAGRGLRRVCIIAPVIAVAGLLAPAAATASSASSDGGHWVLDGGDGNDQVSADRAVLTDSSGNPVLTALPGDYRLSGGPGDDELTGVLYGLPIPEQMDGGAGNDNLAAFAGDDRLQG